jgi:PTS system mannose-specific IID component
MAALGRLVGLRILLRSLLVQASWNYRTMQGAGLGFALIPALARLYRGDRTALAKALRTHCGFFNAHPYLSTVAIAALARMESERADSEQLERFKRAIVSPLGSLGDRLVWARWRPLCSLLAFLIFLLGAPWWVAVAVFLAAYNAVHLWLRVWGLRLGWREGREVGRALMGSPLRRLPDRLTIPLAVVSGAVVPLVALALGGAAGVGPLSTIGIALTLAIAGYGRPGLAGRLAVLGLLVGSLAFVILGTSVW